MERSHETSSSAAQPASKKKALDFDPSGRASGSAAQPAIISSLVGSSAEQPACEAAQPVKALRSITDVQRWLKNNEVVLNSSAEAVRIREVVDALSTKPKPRKEAIERFFKPWGVQQFIKKHRRPLPELIEELNKKVVDAAKKLQQQLSDSAERPALLSDSAERPGSSMVSSAAQPRASSATPAAPQPRSFDIHQSCTAWLNLMQSDLSDPKPFESNPKSAFGLLQDCRKYKKDNWLGVEEDEEIEKIMKQLVIESQPHFSSKLCREIYKHTKVREVIGPFGHWVDGHWEENDHEMIRAVALTLTKKDLASFLSRRDAIPAEEYPDMASLETLGVKVIRKSREKILEEKTLEIFQDMPDTKVLPLLPDFAEHALLYRVLAEIRDKAAGIPIEGPEALKLLHQELRQCREEDEEDPAEKFLLYECRRKWKEQGKTEEECKRMWPQALADWRAENPLIVSSEDSAEQPVKHH